ncbi:MAG: trypco2 family protein [Candidatus Acidiferrales bacterium]
MFKSFAAGIALMTFFAVQSTAQTPAPAPKPKPVTKPTKKAPKPSDTVPLANIVQAVELVVDAYNSRPETQPPNPTLPPLATADFDFKTVVDLKGGPSINFLIFKAGYTHEKQTTNDVSFQYIPQPLKHGGMYAAPVPITLNDQLTQAIEKGANAIKGEQANDKSPLPLSLKTLAVTVAFTVSSDYTGGLTIPIHLVTLGGTADYNTSAVQTVKLTFTFPAKPGDKPGDTKSN